MAGSFYGLEIAKTALFNARTNMDISNHNLANADTIGYTRQRLVTSAIPPQAGKTFLSQGQKTTSGAGVKMEYITQIRDMFLDAKYRRENSTSNYLNTKEYEFSQISALFKNDMDQNDATTGLQLSMLKFSDAMKNLMTRPSDMAIRNATLGAMNGMTKDMGIYYGKLEDQYDNLDNTIENGVKRINIIAKDIGTLNEMIYEYELTGAQANDLRDTRNLLLDELSGLTEMTYKEGDGNDFEVRIGGQILVKGSDTVNQLAMSNTKPRLLPDPNRPSADPTQNLVEVYWEDPARPGSGQPAMVVDPNEPLAPGDPGYPSLPLIPDNTTLVDFGHGKGTIKAALDMRDGADANNKGIPYYVNELNKLARQFVSDFNKVHAQGWTLPIEGPPPVPSHQGEFMFTMYDANGNAHQNTNIQPTLPPLDANGNPTVLDPDLVAQDIDSILGFINMSNFKVSDNISGNSGSVANFALSSEPVLTRPSNPEDGNCVIGDKLFDLFSKKDASGVENHVLVTFKNIIGDVATYDQELVKASKTQSVVMDRAIYERMAVSGVSEDEEMINVIKYSKAFNAASRMITVIDEQLDTMINKMGVVGR